MLRTDAAKRFLRHSIAATCVAYIANDLIWALRLACGRNDTASGTTHAGLTRDASLAIIEKTYDSYRTLTGKEEFHGRVAEIGPGDNLGVSLLLASGGAEVWAVDRYRSRRNPAQELEIYDALVRRHGLTHRFTTSGATVAIEGVRYLTGKSAEDFFVDAELPFDAILSNAVVEHLYDPLRALDGMLAALRPGGWLVHFIDFRDHGMFLGWPALTFLRIPEAIYRRMTRYSGRPNRVLYRDYRLWLEQSGIRDFRLLVTGLVNGWSPPHPIALASLTDPELEPALMEVDRLRDRFAAPFRKHSTHELAVASGVLVAQKPL